LDKVAAYRSELFDGYVPLADVVPLATPFTILIDPTNACNFRCTFCPTGDFELLKSVKRPKGLMDLTLFRKLIEDVSAFDGKLKKLQLYKDGEPLLNRDLPEMVAYAKRRQVSEIVETTTNGALLSADKSLALIEAGLDQIRISVEHVHNEGYRQITKTFSDYDLVRTNVENFYRMKCESGAATKVHVKIVDVGLSDDDIAKFENDFGPISDSLNVDALMDWDGADTRGRDFSLGHTVKTSINGITRLKKNRLVCSAPFKSMAVNFNGEVSVCCVDWSHETIVGDATKLSLVDIWNGDPMRQFRLTHLKGERHRLSACATCKYMLGFSDFENLDHVAEQLSAKIDKRD
jgi:radical SAM protein with 4Fe4S-binding SPASM domain